MSSESKYQEQNDVQERTRFFDGQFLVDYDFIQEQAYHIDRQRNHNRTLHVSGVAVGLQVSSNAGYQVTVTAGTAIDQNGRQLVLKADCTLDVRQLGLSAAPADTPTAGATGYLHLAYNQMPATNAQADQQGVKGQPRWVEIPCLFWYASPMGPGDSYPQVNNNWSNVASYCSKQQAVTGVSDNGADWGWEVWTAVAPPPLLLVKLTLDGAGNITVEDQRSYTGLRLPAPDEMYLQGNLASSTASAGVSFWSSQGGGEPMPRLSVTNDGRVGIGTTVPASTLDVRTDQATLLRLENSARNGSEVHIDLATFDLGTDPLLGLDPSSRISAIDDLAFSNHIAFLTKQSGHETNKLAERLRLTSDGKLGIGTTVAVSALDVRTNQATLLRLENSVGGSGSEVHIDLATYGSGTTPTVDPSARISAIDDVNGSNHIAFLTKQPGALANKLAERLRLTSDGKLGIGTPSPVALLDVNGDLNTSGKVKIGTEFRFTVQPGDEGNAGMITYRDQYDSESLSIVGAGTDYDKRDRNVQIWDTLSIGYSKPKSGVAIFNGNVGIGTQEAKHHLHIGFGNGQIHLGDENNFGEINRWANRLQVRSSDCVTIAIGDVGNDVVNVWNDSVQVNGEILTTGHLWVGGEIFWAAPGWNNDDKGGNKYLQINCHEYPSSGPCWHDMCVSQTGSTPSDLYLKEDIKAVDQALSKLVQLSGVTYHWNEAGIAYASKNIHQYMNAGPQASDAENQALWEHEREEIRNMLAARQIGLIAQDVEKVVPEVVVIDNGGYRRVDYPRLTALLVEAIKELAHEVEVLKANV